MTDKRPIGAKLADTDVASLGKRTTVVMHMEMLRLIKDERYAAGFSAAIEAAAQVAHKYNEACAEEIRKLRPGER